ncbi:MAG: hypothetical protein HY537_08865 [Deltaproteobacteria bacterium]|nr:hypothetical protein [Deltaproteobacteria bacterium]
MSEFKQLLVHATQIAERASEITLSYFRQPLLIELKGDYSPVTIADKKTEEMIRKELERLFPSHNIVGEEFGKTNRSSDYVWTVDPIDGTLSFTRGIPLFGTLLGLLYKQEPVLGVMVLPALSETYSAAKGLGAFCNSMPIRVSTTSTLDSAFISCGDYDCWKKAEKLTYWQALYQKCKIVRGYTDCFAHALVIRGCLDAMIDPIVSLWDVVPIACLIREAGGEYFNLDGKQDVFSSSFATCNPKLKPQLLNL